MILTETQKLQNLIISLTQSGRLRIVDGIYLLDGEVIELKNLSNVLKKKFI